LSFLKAMRLKKYIYITLGFFFVGLGVLGIFVPLLPTTVFLLIAAYLFAKSSDKYYNWLITNKYFGKFIRDYREGKGVPLKVKTISLTALWVTILFSVFFVVKVLWLKLLLIAIAIGVSWHLLSLKTRLD